MGYFTRNYVPCTCTFTTRNSLTGEGESSRRCLTLQAAGLTCSWASALLAPSSQRQLDEAGQTFQQAVSGGQKPEVLAAPP